MVEVEHGSTARAYKKLVVMSNGKHIAHEGLKQVRAAVDSGECRGDEDCDHCFIVYKMIDPILAVLEKNDQKFKEISS